VKRPPDPMCPLSAEGSALPSDQPWATGMDQAGATDDVLELLSPWALAADAPADVPHRAPLSHALGVVLRLVDAPDMDLAEALAALQAARKALPADAARPLDLEYTDTPLKAMEVTEYDRYFGLRHQESDTPGIRLVLGLLIMLERFLVLRAALPHLERDALELQMAGLRSHARLLGRVLHLDLVADTPSDRPSDSAAKSP